MAEKQEQTDDVQDFDGEEVPLDEAFGIAEDAAKQGEGAEKPADDAETAEPQATEEAESEETDATEESEDPQEPEAPERDDSIAAEMAGLTHDDVRNSQAFKGVMGELQKERTARKAAETALKEKGGEAEAETEDDEDDEDLLDFDLSVTDDDETGGESGSKPEDIDKLVDARVDERLKPIEAEFNARQSAQRRTTFQEGLDGLLEAQKAGEIPKGLNTDKLMRQVLDHAKEHEPETLKLLDKPNGVRKLYEYARVSIPEIGEAIADARTAENETEEDRIASGLSDGNTAIAEFANVLDSR